MEGLTASHLQILECFNLHTTCSIISGRKTRLHTHGLRTSLVHRFYSCLILALKAFGYVCLAVEGLSHFLLASVLLLDDVFWFLKLFLFASRTV